MTVNLFENIYRKETLQSKLNGGDNLQKEQK